MGLTRSGRNRRWAWLLVALLSSCLAPVKNNAAPPKTAVATGKVTAAPEPPEPVDGETSPDPRGAIGPFDTHIQSIATSNGTIAISVAGATSVRLFDSRTGQSTGELPCPTHNVVGLRFSPDGKHLGAISPQLNEVYVWDVAARTAARTVRSPNRAWGALPLRGGAKVAIAGEHGLLVIAAVDTGQVVRSIPVRDKSTVYGLAASKSGKWLAGVVAGRSMIVIDLERNDSIRTADADKKMQLLATEFSPDDLSVIARGSSFMAPKMVQVGAHPEGADPTAAPSYASCGAAIIPTGLIGYAICAAIVGNSAASNDQAATKASRPDSDDRPPDRAADASSDGHPTVDIAGLAGELMLWPLDEPQPIVVKTFGRTFEQMAWSKDGTKVALVASGIQDGELVKRILVYQRRQISGRSGTLPPPVNAVTLGRVTDLLLGAIDTDQATLFMERRRPAGSAPATPAPVTAAPSKPQYTIERWPISALQTPVDESPAAAATGSPAAR